MQPLRIEGDDWYFVPTGYGELQGRTAGAVASAIENVHRGGWHFVPLDYSVRWLVSSVRGVYYADDSPRWDVDDDYFDRRLEDSGDSLSALHDFVPDDRGRDLLRGLFVFLTLVVAFDNRVRIW